MRQLKLILQRNCINYKGCVEKQELLERVVRLWRARQQEKGGASHTHGPCNSRYCCVSDRAAMESKLAEKGDESKQHFVILVYVL